MRLIEWPHKPKQNRNNSHRAYFVSIIASSNVNYFGVGLCVRLSSDVHKSEIKQKCTKMNYSVWSIGRFSLSKMLNDSFGRVADPRQMFRLIFNESTKHNDASKLQTSKSRIVWSGSSMCSPNTWHKSQSIEINWRQVIILLEFTLNMHPFLHVF